MPFNCFTFSEYAPELRSTFQSQSLRQGLSIDLKCAAFGSPLPQVRWFFYSKLLSDQSYQNRYRISDYVDSNGVIVSYLNITNITRENGGLYSCEAISRIDSVKHSAKIHVYGSPYVHHMDNVTIVSSQKLYIDCPISGHPIDSIIWRKGNFFLDLTLINIFSFLAVQHFDNLIYLFILINDAKMMKKFQSQEE